MLTYLGWAYECFWINPYPYNSWFRSTPGLTPAWLSLAHLSPHLSINFQIYANRLKPSRTNRKIFVNTNVYKDIKCAHYTMIKKFKTPENMKFWLNIHLLSGVFLTSLTQKKEFWLFPQNEHWFVHCSSDSNFLLNHMKHTQDCDKFKIVRIVIY